MKFVLTLLCVAASAIAPSTCYTESEAKDLLIKANDQFTAKMFAEVLKTKSQENLVMSAFSVLTPLGQLEIAAEGESQDELARAIGIPRNAIMDVFSYLNRNLKSVEKLELKSASKLYIPYGAELNDSFADISREVFQSVPENIDFSKSKEAAETINKWVEEQTNNRIKNLIQESNLPANTKLVLVNALYFKGSWKFPFNVEFTKERDFYVTKEKNIKLPTMERIKTFNYGESAELDAKLVELPYEGGEASMVIILPNEIDGLETLENKLQDPSLLSKAISEMTTDYEVTVRLPKLKIETEMDLKQVLSGMEVNKIFNNDAKLNLIKGVSDLFVNAAKQKSFIEVNEFGTEAAAANEFILLGSSMYRPQQRQFYADHPFVFIIQMRSLTLFSGVYRQ